MKPYSFQDGGLKIFLKIQERERERERERDLHVSVSRLLESLTDQILKSDVIPILIEKELEGQCCVRGHHVYESNWDAKTGSKLKPCHKKRPSALVEDKYGMALKFNDTTVAHVPKFCSKITYIFLKLEGDLVVKITGQRRYSQDLDQGRMELPGTYVFISTDAEMHAKLDMLVKEAMEQYNNKTNEKEREKKIMKNK